MSSDSPPASPALSTFVDNNNQPICLKFAGYYSNFRRVPPFHCRWKDSCNLSHEPPSLKTTARLEKEHQKYLIQQNQKDVEQATATKTALSRPLPAWFAPYRTTLTFQTDTTAAYRTVLLALTELLKLSWCLNGSDSIGVASTLVKEPLVIRSKQVQDEKDTSNARQAELDAMNDEQRELFMQAKSLDRLHEITHLRPNYIPVVPTLAHASRLAGIKFPKSWTKSYKQTKKMVKFMERTTEYKQYLAAYRQFVRDVVLPLCCTADNRISAIVYQIPPTLRIVPPGKSPTIHMHCDSDYDRHENGEINFWVPLTKVWGNNSLWCESAPNVGDFSPFELEIGQGVRFNGNQCRHYTNINDTDFTRVSFDFRVIPVEVAVRPATFGGRIGDYATEVMERDPGAVCGT